MRDKSLLDRALGLLPGDVAGSAVADVEPHAAAASGQDLRQQAPVIVEDPVRGRRIHVRDDVAALEQGEDLGERRVRLPQVDHHWQVEPFRHRLRACECCEIAVGAAPGPLLHPSLDSDDRVAMTGNGRTCQRHIGEVKRHLRQRALAG